MSYAYPLDMPARPGFVDSYLDIQRQISGTDSVFTGEEQMQEHGGAFWIGLLTLPPMTQARAGPWRAFFGKMHGRVGTVMVGDPDYRGPYGMAQGSPVVDGAGQTGTILATRGWTAGTSGQLIEGDYIQVGQRLHQVVGTVVSDGAGLASIPIEPYLRESPNDGDPVVLDKPKGIFRLGSDSNPMRGDVHRYQSVSFSIREALVP